MIPKFDDNRNLPAGFIKSELEWIEESFVGYFQDSTTHQEIFNGYIRHNDKLDAIKVATIRCVNGSYTTSKENLEYVVFITRIGAIEIAV